MEYLVQQLGKKFRFASCKVRDRKMVQMLNRSLHYDHNQGHKENVDMSRSCHTLVWDHRWSSQVAGFQKRQVFVKEEVRSILHLASSKVLKIR